MNTTRFTNMIKKMVLPLVVCGMMCTTGVYAQDPLGDIIGFSSLATPGTIYTTPGYPVRFKIRLYGTIVVSNLFNVTYVQPQIQMLVGSDQTAAYATLVQTDWINGPGTDRTRTDLTFEYIVRPGDMADPLKIYGPPTYGFNVIPHQCWFYKVYPGNISSNVTWSVNRDLYNLPSGFFYDTDAGISDGDTDLSTLRLKIRTLSFDALNCPSPLVARQPGNTWRIKSNVTTNIPINVMIWTPHTNLLQIGTSPNQALLVTIPANSDFYDFPIKGLNTNAIPTYATVYAQRPSDYDNNETSVTNFIIRTVEIAPPGTPTISLEFANLQSTMTISETNDTDTGSFRIVLSEADSTGPVYVRFDVANQPSNLVNIVVSNPTDGDYHVDKDAERSGWYYFSAVNGTRESKLSPRVHIKPVATNTAKYSSFDGIVQVDNVAPTVQWFPPAVADEDIAVAFEWSDLVDVGADISRGIVFKWLFGDGPSITQTNYAFSGEYIKTYTTPGTYTASLIITDADGASYTTPTQTVVVNAAPKPANVSVVVNRDDFTYQEGDTTARYRVVLSAPALQTTYVTLKGQYLLDDTSSDDCLTLNLTNIVIGAGLTSSAPISMTIKDGTIKTSIGIQIIPAITNAAAQAQYPGAYSGFVVIENVAPGIDANPTCLPTTAPVSPYNNIEVNQPFAFKYRATDINADRPGITVEFQFEDGTTTNITGVTGSATKTFTTLGPQIVTMIARDKDGGETQLAFPIIVVPPLPIPWVKVDNYPVMIAENDTSSKNLTITLSQSPASAGITDPVVVDLVTQPGTNNLNGSVEIPTSVTFYSSETTKTIQFTVQDGTRLSTTSGFIVRPSIAPTNAAAVLKYKDCQPGRVLVQNVAPVIQDPRDQSTNTVATIGQPCTFNWNVVDVAADLPGMTLVWSWGDGTPDTITTGGSGSTNHIFNTNASTANVRVTATDKDGGFSYISFYVTLRASKTITALPIGPNATVFNGFTGLGLGSIAAPEASRTTFDNNNLFYTFYFGANATDAQLIATPSNKVDGVKQSYFFAWDGPLTAFQNPLHVTKPLAPSVTRILFPSGTAGATTGTGTTANNGVDVSAIFSIEFAMFDGCGDINQDGIPDNRIQTYFIDPTKVAGNATQMDTIWFTNLRGYNDDNDFYPVYPTGDAQGVMDFRPIPHPNTDANGVAVNAFTAFKEIRGYDGVIGRIQDLGVPRGDFNDDPGTNPTLLDTDKDGYPDGWEYWFYYQSYRNGRTGSRYNPRNIAQGDRIAWSEIIGAFDPRVGRDQYPDSRWLEDFDNDGLLDSEELTIGTDPTNWDTDADGMADGWEIIRGFNPCDGRDGLLPAQNNPDGDYFAISTALRQHIQVVTSSNSVVSTNHYLAVLDATNNVIYSKLTTAYRYGNDTAPWAVGRLVSSNVLTVANQIAAPASTNINALILHFQVRDEKGFDPRTAWVGTVGRFGGYGAGGGAPAGWTYEDTDRFGIWVGNHAPNTRPFTAVDEYLLMKFMYELQLNGMVGPNGWIAHVEDHIENNESTRLLVQDAWTRFTTHPRTPDTDATQALSDGIPDGWELYTALPPVPHGVPRPAFGAFINSPWDPNDHDHDIDINLNPTGDAVTYQSEFWGTDSVTTYQNANLYYSGVTNVMRGVVTIQRPAGDADTFWVNKFWPTDPWNRDTDSDSVNDGAERAFIYGNAVDNGSVCIAGGGFNPNSIDTDRDALPDAWENQFAGTPVAADGTTTLPPVLPGQPAIAVTMSINNGQDGTVVDPNKDVDLDGLVSYQEYMTQSIRAYRYDIPAFNVTDPATRQIGQPMNSTFEIGSIFTEVTNAWDQCRTGWPTPASIMWWMRPAGARYCSTDPNNPDSDYDGMDDYYEVFHGVNPLLGNGIRLDLLDDRVAYAYGALDYPAQGNPHLYYARNYWTLASTYRVDFNLFPWLNGMPDADPDADGLLNLEEMLAINTPLSENYNTDPSPLWMTDPSNLNSLTARFYAPHNGLSAYRTMFFWPASLPPIFTFQFEMNEGYDTDNDGVSDKDELIANRNTKSDPRDSEDPIRRQAIWFSGTNSAAVTPYMYTDLNTIAGLSFADMEHAFRSFTVELWVRPEWATNFAEQILIERAFNYGQSDASQVPVVRLRRNFLVGIAPDGRVFGGFDNAGGHDEHTDSVRLFGEKIVANTWVHLAARMDGRTQMFTLFVNGVSQGEMSTSLIPATGLDPVRYYPTQAPVLDVVTRRGTLIMGAANNQISSLWVGIGYDLALARSMWWLATWPDYEKFYRGWMDEVRVWDGARSNQEINDNFRKSLTREDIIANRTLILAELNSGANRTALSMNNFLSPILMNYYTFNNLFSAHTNDVVAQVPRGFNSTAVNVNRPNGNVAGATVGWWDQCLVKNTVYNNYNYLPWIENVPAHMPRVSTIVNTNGATSFVNDNVVTDSIYWTRRSAGTNLTQNSFPNNNNPYGFTYDTTQGDETYYATHAIDLLPIGDAWAKQCVDFWDEKGASGNWLENSGTTDDGLPSWWTSKHGAPTGRWNDLYNGSNAYYRVNGMTYGEAYQRDLAKGMLPYPTSYTNFNSQYAQTADSNGDGMPDWWKRLYGLSTMDKTGDNGPVGDPDKDGLSNYSEYLITEVYNFRYSNPLKFKTNPAQPVSDYFIKPDGGRLIYGAMFSDHDFIEDWWEEMYSPTAANPYVFDSKTDYDADGWSNWAEARYSHAIATVRPDLPEKIMVNGIATYEFPIPIVNTRLNYKGVQTGGNVVIQAFSTPAMDGSADATWSIALGQNNIQQNTLPLGFYENKIIRTRLSPGSVVANTIRVRFTDSWTGAVALNGFDMNGILYANPLVGGVAEPMGTINYVTGEVVFNMGVYSNSKIVLNPANYPQQRASYVDAELSYFEMTYSTKLPSGWPQHIYLGRGLTGALKEGKNYFFAFIDVNGNGAWDAGEPAGIPTPFETDIGWDENPLNIQLTDYTPYNLRLSLTTGLRSEDIIFGTAGNTQGGGGQQTTAGSYQRVRIVRSAVQTSSFTAGPIFDKTIFGRDYIHEGDLMTMPVYAGFGLDWGLKGIQFPNSVGLIEYKVYVGEQEPYYNSTLVATFTNKFDSARAVPVNVLPANNAYVYTARPTFSWSVTSVNGGYNAFAFELRKGSRTGPLVYPVTIRQAPLKDTQTGNYVWEAPFFMGDTNVVNNGIYYWRVQMLNPRYSTTNAVDAEWSSPKYFRWECNTPNPAAGVLTNLNGSSSGYGQLRAIVKYFGPVTNLMGRVVVQAFNNRGFTGLPAAQYVYTANQITSITNTSLSVTNQIFMRGLTPGTYYVRAFIDSNANGVLDTWESWGYANYYGENRALYDVRPLDVSFSAISPLATVYIEDADTDQDWFPDGYEYEQNSTNSAFLGEIGPSDGWSTRGDPEYNPGLTAASDASSFMRVLMSMASGSSSQQAAIFKLVADGSSLTTTDAAVTIQTVSFGTGAATLNWDLTPEQTTTSPLLAFFPSASGAQSAAAPKTYTYNVKYSSSLATPRSEWVTVRSTTVTEDANGTQKGASTVTDNSVSATNGFFYIEVVPVIE